MKDYYIKSAADLAQLDGCIKDLITTNEYVFLEKSPEMEVDDFYQFVAKLSKSYEKVYLKKQLNGFVPTKGIPNYCLKFEIELDAENIPPDEIRRNVYPLSWIKSLKYLDDLVKGHPGCVFSVEIFLKQQTVTHLYPVLQFILEARLVNVVLINPGTLRNQKEIESVRNAFGDLEISARNDFNIYMSRSREDFNYWEAVTRNLFRGPTIVDIDVCNVCSHNCEYCGMYAPKVVKRYKQGSGGSISPNQKKLLTSKIQKEKCLKLIDDLPENVLQVQFGGLGEPLLHPNILEFIKRARERNFNVSVLTNFSSMTKEIIDELFDYSGTNPESIHFVVNFSASNYDLYKKTRPSVSKKVYDNIVECLEYVGQRYRERNKGPTVTLMPIVYSRNFLDLPNLAILAKKINALRFWPKPVEAHAPETIELLVDTDNPDYLNVLALTIKLAEEINLPLKNHDELIAILQNNKNGKKFLKADYSKELQRIINGCSLDRSYCYRYDNDLVLNNPNYPSVAKYSHGNIDSSNYYDHRPCFVGYHYLRIETTGRVLPCCVSSFSVGNVCEKSLKEIWFSSAMSKFRNKMETIHKDQFHKKHYLWAFCNCCPHIGINRGVNSCAVDQE